MNEPTHPPTNISEEVHLEQAIRLAIQKIINSETEKLTARIKELENEIEIWKGNQ